MRTLRATAIVLFLVSTPLAASTPKWQIEKAASVDKTIRLLQEVANMARTHNTHYPDRATQAKLGKLLVPLKTVDELTHFALLAGALRGGLAGEQNYDSVFEEAMWLALHRLATIPGYDAGLALEHILKPVLGRDGHPSEEFGELISKQKRLRPAK